VEYKPKHLPRDAQPTVAIIDAYCAEYKDIFKEVRSASNIYIFGNNCTDKRKSLPEIAKVVSINSMSHIIFYYEFRVVSR